MRKRLCKGSKQQNTGWQEETANMLRFQDRINRLTLHCEEEQIQKKLSKLAEELYFCVPTSTPNALEIDNEISAFLTEIEEAALSLDIDSTSALCDRMTGLLKERDRICKRKR